MGQVYALESDRKSGIINIFLTVIFLLSLNNNSKYYPQSGVTEKHT